MMQRRRLIPDLVEELSPSTTAAMRSMTETVLGSIIKAVMDTDGHGNTAATGASQGPFKRRSRTGDTRHGEL